MPTVNLTAAFVEKVKSNDRRIESIQRIVKASGVEFRGHDLRRTAASLMTSAGVPRLVVGNILNHVEPGVTKVYDRYTYYREKRGAESLGLEGEVKFGDIEFLRQGMDPDGNFLSQRRSADRLSADGSIQSHSRHLYDFAITIHP